MLSHPLGGGAELRPLEPWRATEFAAFVDRNREHLSAWLPWPRRIVDAATARAWLQGYADQQAAGTGQVLGLWHDGELVGGTVFRNVDETGGSCELGVWIAAGAGGRGLVTRACRAMIDWAFAVRGMHRVEWRAVAANDRSLAMATRLGMTREGVLRSAFPLDGVRHDVEIWALVRD